MDHILSIDQGTTSSRAVIFDEIGTPINMVQQEFSQYFPYQGWVEHDPEEIWTGIKDVLKGINFSKFNLAAIGITNQRETTLIWERSSGKPISPAIVWQDRRTAEYCQNLKNSGIEFSVHQKTGLMLDPYFSATKIKWILDNVSGARARAKNGDLAFGTIDTFLIWRLTNGRSHVTDATNASRTMLFNILTQNWDQELLALFDIPEAILPEVLDSAAEFGVSEDLLSGTVIPIRGVAGDQHASTIGQGCTLPGMLKSTYGTGCFAMLNTGEEMKYSSEGLLTTPAYRLDGKVTYALEGSIFMAGATIQWLRDNLKIIQNASDTELLAQELNSNAGVYLVPAFVGLGTPYWEPDARASITGLGRDSEIAHIARAALESVAYQTFDLITAMVRDSGLNIPSVRVDGGMTQNNWLMQFLANVIDITVERPTFIETTAKGAFVLAALQSNILNSISDVESAWIVDKSFESDIKESQRRQLIDGWQQAVDSVIGLSKFKSSKQPNEDQYYSEIGKKIADENLDDLMSRLMDD